MLVVGWSLGGLFARELARALPGTGARGRDARLALSRAIRKQNNVWRLYEWVAGHKVDDPPMPRITDKPPVPTLAIWSRRDGLIAPRAARGLDHERDEEVELDCTTWPSACRRERRGEVVREIDKFLKRHT